MTDKSKRTYDQLYVSPHLDDAVFSCGGRIAAAVASGRRVMVVTVFTQWRTQRGAPGQLDAFSLATLRKAEDKRALRSIGADFLWMEHIDAIQRSRRYRHLVALTALSAPVDAQLATVLARELRAIIRDYDPSQVFFPLAIGEHIDHRLVFQAGASLAPQLWPVRDIVFYEDAPYVYAPHLLRARLRRLGWRVRGRVAHRRTDSLFRSAGECATYVCSLPLAGTRRGALVHAVLRCYVLTLLISVRRALRTIVELDPEIIETTSFGAAKDAASAAYDSQLDAIYGSRSRLQRETERYERRLANDRKRYERYWRLKVNDNSRVR